MIKDKEYLKKNSLQIKKIVQESSIKIIIQQHSK